VAEYRAPGAMFPVIARAVRAEPAPELSSSAAVRKLPR
jgi:hypothetical protein